ncbi:hypothetical protein E2C01_015679 [Portunus trituberculatus]|uniref:Uncharacterized protein n=1 Tax=Portunus trituberculatus TaxID=210409 RepID=A0A5B7DNM8_PORTR|nr:hypothetical protein [Portunus trituberculatus]
MNPLVEDCGSLNTCTLTRFIIFTLWYYCKFLNEKLQTERRCYSDDQSRTTEGVGKGEGQGAFVCNHVCGCSSTRYFSSIKSNFCIRVLKTLTIKTLEY